MAEQASTSDARGGVHLISSVVVVDTRSGLHPLESALIRATNRMSSPEGRGHTVSVDGEPEFQRITVIAGYECFLWAVEPESGEERLVGIDFDVLGIDVPQGLVEQFLQWHREWEEARKFVFDPTYEPRGEEWFREFHADGRALAEELSAAIGQPVEYRS